MKRMHKSVQSIYIDPQVLPLSQVQKMERSSFLLSKMLQTCLMAQSFVRQGLCRHEYTRYNARGFASEPCYDTIKGDMSFRSRLEWPLLLSKLEKDSLRSMDGNGQKGFTAWTPHSNKESACSLTRG